MRNLRVSRIFNIFILLLGLLLSLLITQLISQKQELQVFSELDDELIDFERKMVEELVASGEVLHSVSNLFNAVEDFTPEVFNDFTKNLIQRKKSILIVEWQPVVPSSQREAFIQNARKKGIKDFDFWELDKDGALIKANKREIHVPVLYAVSTSAISKTVGLDLAFSPERMNSKWESLETGMPRASETFQVIVSAIEKLLPTGFAITIPVFKRGAKTGTLAERKQNISGFVAAVFDVEKLLLSPIELLYKKDIDFKFVDLENKRVVLERRSDHPSSISRSMKMDVFGRKWKVTIFAGEKFVNSVTNLREYIFPLVLAFFFWVLYLFLEMNRVKSIDLMETQEKLKVKAREAEAAAYSKAMFLANMSHELRTPLSAMLGYGELMKREKDPLKHARYLDIIIRSSKHLAEVINDILDFSKLEECKFELKSRAFQLKNVLNQLDELVVSQFNNPNVQYIKRIDVNVDETLFGDEFRIKQILINLLSNAFKFTAQGLITLTIQKAMIDENRFQLMIQVSDTGKGMSSDFQKHIFDPFTQEDISFSREHRGTGLGLSIVFRLVKLMGGSISLNSELNQGSTFVITLPFQNN